jgi:DNA repair protein RecO (recombination protein O)
VRPTEHTTAVLLRSVAFGEADRIVTLLTERFGKVALIARGARKSGRRFAGSLEPYALIEAEVALGRGDVGRLAEARVVRAFPGLLTSLEKMSLAAAGLEVVRESTAEREPEPRLLGAIERFFELLERGRPTDELRIAFVLRVLAIAGLGPNLEHCGRCGRRAPERKAALFDPALGALVCRACGGARIVLAGSLRERMSRAGGRAWDEVAVQTWDGVEGARAALDGMLERHVSARLSGAVLLDKVRAIELAEPPAAGPFAAGPQRGRSGRDREGGPEGDGAQDVDDDEEDARR